MVQRTQIVGYVRVSSDDQNLARQLEAIGEVDRVFSDKVSGGNRESRAALEECITYIRDGDVVRVASMDRLARSLRDMRDIVDDIVGKGATVQFIKEGQTYSADRTDALSQLMLNMLAAFAEHESQRIDQNIAVDRPLQRRKTCAQGGLEQGGFLLEQFDGIGVIITEQKLQASDKLANPWPVDIPLSRLGRGLAWNNRLQLHNQRSTTSLQRGQLTGELSILATLLQRLFECIGLTGQRLGTNGGSRAARCGIAHQHAVPDEVPAAGFNAVVVERHGGSAVLLGAVGDDIHEG